MDTDRSLKKFVEMLREFSRHCTALAKGYRNALIAVAKFERVTSELNLLADEIPTGTVRFTVKTAAKEISARGDALLRAYMEFAHATFAPDSQKAQSNRERFLTAPLECDPVPVPYNNFSEVSGRAGELAECVDSTIALLTEPSMNESKQFDADDKLKLSHQQQPTVRANNSVEFFGRRPTPLVEKLAHAISQKGDKSDAQVAREICGDKGGSTLSQLRRLKREGRIKIVSA